MAGTTASYDAVNILERDGNCVVCGNEAVDSYNGNEYCQTHLQARLARDYGG